MSTQRTSGMRVFLTSRTMRREWHRKKGYSRRVKRPSAKWRREWAQLNLKYTLFPTPCTGKGEERNKDSIVVTVRFIRFIIVAVPRHSVIVCHLSYGSLCSLEGFVGCEDFEVLELRESASLSDDFFSLAMRPSFDVCCYNGCIVGGDVPEVEDIENDHINILEIVVSHQVDGHIEDDTLCRIDVDPTIVERSIVRHVTEDFIDDVDEHLSHASDDEL
ncbi:uncharacterized protein E5676_scaffold500G001210 [Cucumis melo var. makuwa]|uniref:Uncharacterized protein n=1 Tax=Cucumis melo var. makuwa TaxID=1194695 RepID=A0A5A7TQG9_CUCMM|nr:uncharacterized protein E6C27_scaffold30G001270 [Cucumis melo var. makuwa]TYK23609.1 uncharacterized protein E5676_scaffold500G001210 [Cucumis melo var. makuwa]